MANLIGPVIPALVIILLYSSFDPTNGHPLTQEDVQSLLPVTPETKNETIAAIVQDDVVKDAVQSIVADGTLTGLVVKKNTVILPADEPDVILTQNEQILTAPLAHLEDIRKNITESVAATNEKENSEVTNYQEISLAQVIPIEEENEKSITTENIYDNSKESLIVESLVLDELEPSSSLSPIVRLEDEVVEKEVVELPRITDKGIKLPEGVIPQSINLPDVVADKISAPLVAIVNPEANLSKYEDGDEPAPRIITFLKKNEDNDSSVKSINDDSDEKEEEEEEKEEEEEVENNSGDKKIIEYGTRIPVAVINSEEFDHPAVKVETMNNQNYNNNRSVDIVELFNDYNKNEKNYLKSDKNYEDISKNDGDDDDDDDDVMVAAEDIIFRPLFRYRQEQNERTRILRNRAWNYNNYNYNQRTDSNNDNKNNRYKNYNPSDYNYYPGQNSYYKRNRRPKYSQDYDY